MKDLNTERQFYRHHSKSLVNNVDFSLSKDAMAAIDIFCYNNFPKMEKWK